MSDIRKETILRQIEKLPKGNITYKKINDKKYPYLQWSEGGKQRNRIIKEDEIETLFQQIEERKQLEKKLKESSASVETFPEYFSVMRLGSELVNYVSPVKKFKKREIYSSLYDYVYGDSTDRVFILYGLRRTGKTTLIRQVIGSMPEEMLLKTAFIQTTSSIDLTKINHDLKQLETEGYKYIFIDEVTLMEDFIEGAALFSDVYAASGMKIVLSGTDSLGFIFSEDRELYDRCYMAHTTFIPYREFENILGIKGIDEYIRYGGTMSLGGINYNNSGMTFATKENTDEYIDSAIARNIQHSLKNYQYGNHFRNLTDLFEADELTSAINRIVEDINHRFTVDVLTQQFKSSDLSISNKNLLKDRNNPTDILSRIDTEKVTARLKEYLEIKNKPEQTVKLSEVHRREIKEYLDLLDLTVETEARFIPTKGRNQKRTVITQPGMRYSQAESLIKSLMSDEVFSALSLIEKNSIRERIVNEVMGRMMEDIVLLETKFANPSKEVFKLQFAVGEFDMVIFDPEVSSCEIYEIKHNKEIIPRQYRYLTDTQKCEDTKFSYGEITGKYVVYRGETTKKGDIQYLNVEEYLKNLKN